MEKKHQKLLGLRVSALMEIMIFLIVALLADFLLFDGTRFYSVCPHPFSILVLLVAAQYGTAEGLVAALACTFFLLFGNLPPQGISENLYDYIFNTAKTPLIWLVSAVALGELRLRHVRERNQLQGELEDSREREEKIAESYQRTKSLKEKLELRIAGRLHSSVAAYQAARTMESLDNTQVLSGLEELVSAVLDPDKFSIFLLGEGGALTLALSHGWGSGDALPTAYDSTSDLTRAVVGSRMTVCSVNPEHERLLKGEGVLAAPIIDAATGSVLGMIKIERIGFTELNLSSIETFNAIGQWAGATLVNARKYGVAKEGSIVNPDHNLLSRGYFQRHAEFVTALGKRVGFDVNMIAVRIIDGDRLDADTRLQAGRALSAAVDRVLRAIDLAFDYQGTSEDYSIVLTATDKKGAEIVLDKIRTALTPVTPRGVSFTFSIQTLQTKA